jgi:hypothetical protein
VIEGVYGWLAVAALPFASSLIWLDLPWTECSRRAFQARPLEGSDGRRARDFSAMGRSLLAAHNLDFVCRSPGAVRKICRTETAYPVAIGN